MTRNDETDTGYKRPPVATRFKQGQSGNPKGRPRGRHKQLPYEAVLGQLVTVREDGIERKVTAGQAFLLHLTRKGLEGDGAAARAALAALERARSSGLTEAERVTCIIYRGVAVGSVSSALEKLRMATKHDRFRDTARILLEPWVVEAAIARLGSRRLSPEEQLKVVRATRTPYKVRWPEWWSVHNTKA